MSLRTLFLLAVVAVIAVFAAINWTAFTTPTTLSLVFAKVEAPLGIVMLVITGMVGVLFLTYVVYLQSTILLESRRNARELETQRKLADEAEASRFTELRTLLEGRSSAIEAALAQSQSALQNRLDGISADLKATVEQSGTVLSAYIGEVEDRLERKLSSARGTPP